MTKEFGFVSEPHKHSYHLVSPATKIDGEITSHDLSGYLGSWPMKEGGVFFASISGEAICTETMKLANEYARKINGE